MLKMRLVEENCLARRCRFLGFPRATCHSWDSQEQLDMHHRTREITQLYMLQRTATDSHSHCQIVQHPATSTTLHIATHCNTLTLILQNPATSSNTFTLTLRHAVTRTQVQNGVCYITGKSHNSTSCTGWRRLIGCLKLQVIFRKRATNYSALLRKMTYEDKASYDSAPSCNILQHPATN